MAGRTYLQDLNLSAQFLPMEPDDESTLPCVETGGAQVYTYWTKEDGLCVSVHLDTGEIPEQLHNHDGTVPVQVTVNDETVFSAVPDRIGLIKAPREYLVLAEDEGIYREQWHQAWKPTREVLEVVAASPDLGERERQENQLSEARFDSQSPVHLLTITAASQADAAGQARREKLRELAEGLGTNVARLLAYHDAPQLTAPEDIALPRTPELASQPGSATYHPAREMADAMCAYVALARCDWRPREDADNDAREAWREFLEAEYEQLTETLIGYGRSKFEAVRMALQDEREANRQRRGPRHIPFDVTRDEVYEAIEEIEHGSGQQQTLYATHLGYILISHG